MNDETLQTEEPTVPEAETSLPSETEVASPGDGPVTEETYEISETMAYISSEELVLEDGSEATEETVSITVQDLHSLGSDIVHANLFGSFLICGTLVGIFLLRGRYGT